VAKKQRKTLSRKHIKKIDWLLEPFRVEHGKRFRLKDHDPGDTRGIDSERKSVAQELLQLGVEWLAEAQTKLYAQDRWAMLLVFQAMDAAGKDSTIKHVMSGVNPQGVQVSSFKYPSSEELDHDFMWRYAKAAPERGRIGIFNRSYYEEVLVVRVHKKILQDQHLPQEVVSKDIWKERLEAIRGYERYLAQNGVSTLKFFLNVSRDEQKKRFLERLDEPEKNWKFSTADVQERGFWNDYMKAYEHAIRATATPDAPWFVVPADNKWFTRLVVAAAIVQRLDQLDLRFPKIDSAQRAELELARQELEKQ
jgi:PPK2 family polyphosphate:nucleotide phosphotransferase